MRDLRMKIAAFTIALGLGGLGGYAVSSSKTQQATTETRAQGTKVIRRTVHATRPKVKAARHSHAGTRQTPASAPVSTGSSGSGSSGSSSTRPVSTGSSGSSGGGSGHSPVSTGSSGGGAAGGGGTGEADDGGEHEGGGD